MTTVPQLAMILVSLYKSEC